MAIYKADARIYSNEPGSNAGTFKLTILSVSYPGGSLGYITMDNKDPDILSSTLQTDIISAVKNYWNLGALDMVRML